MNARLKELLALPAEERAELADALYESLDDDDVEPSADVERAWGAAIEERIGDVDNGRVELIPASEVIGDLKAELARLR